VILEAERAPEETHRRVEIEWSLAGWTIEKAGESLCKVGEVIPLGLPVADPNIAGRDTEMLELTRQPGFVNGKECPMPSLSSADVRFRIRRGPKPPIASRTFGSQERKGKRGKGKRVRKRVKPTNAAQLYGLQRPEPSISTTRGLTQGLPPACYG